MSLARLHIVLSLGFAFAILAPATTSAEAPGPDMRLRTDDTVLMAHVEDSQLQITRLGPAGTDVNWIDKGFPFTPGVMLLVDDQPQVITWRWTGSSTSTNSITSTFQSDKPALSLELKWVTHPGPGPIEQTIAVSNHSDQAVTLTGMPSLSLTLNPPADAKLEHMWVEKGAGQPTDVGVHRSTIGKDFHERSASSPRAERYHSGEAIPWQCIHDTRNGVGLYTVAASSAHIAQEVTSDPDSGTLQVTVGLDERVAPFKTVIKPGGKLTFPIVFFGCYRGTIDDGCNRLHRWADKWWMAPSGDTNLPLLVHCSWGSALKISDASCRKMIDADAEMGVEMFHIDAGWYRKIGWWRHDPKKFPNGMRAMSDYAHSKGLKFGLWVAWAQGGDAREGNEAMSVFEPTMRDWFPTDMPADWKPPKVWIGEGCCLGSPAARAWCLNELRRIVREDNLDMLEHDQQVITWKCTRTDHDHTSSPVDAGLAAANGYYEVYDTLRKEFPNLLLEDCVDGGETIDYGILHRCNYVSITDHYDPISNRRAFHDASYPFPPRTLECYLGKHPVKSIDNFKYFIRSGMLGWCSVMVDTTTWTEEQRAVAKRQFDIYKQTMRPLIRDAQLFHVGERPKPDGWDAYQYATIEKGDGALVVFRANAANDRQKFKLFGLAKDATYDLSFEDDTASAKSVTGQELMSDGLEVSLPEKETSAIIYLKRR